MQAACVLVIRHQVYASRMCPRALKLKQGFPLSYSTGGEGPEVSTTRKSQALTLVPVKQERFLFGDKLL